MKILIDQALIEQVLDDIYGAKLCEINSMSSRQEMLRLMNQAITALRQAKEQAQQAEPVAWATSEDFYRELDRSVNRMRQQMEIKGVVMRCADYDVALPIIDIREGRVLVGQVATPPPRQPLTDEEIFDLAEPFGAFQYGDAQGHKRIAFARAIEAARSIKGEA